jgi:hypothetical protein
MAARIAPTRGSHSTPLDNARWKRIKKLILYGGLSATNVARTAKEDTDE